MRRARVWDSHLSVDWSKSLPSPLSRAQRIFNRQPFRYWSSKVLNQSTHSNSWRCERKATFVTHDTIERKRIKSNPSKSKYVCIANGRNQTAGITHRRRCDDEGCVELPPLPSGSSEKYWIGAWLIICQSVLIYWLVFETSACESADCRLLAFVCAGSALGLEMYLCAFASARERLHKHHQFKSTVEYQSANKFRARVANTQSEEEQKNASRASCSATKACKKQWRQQASSSSNYLYDCDC